MLAHKIDWQGFELTLEAFYNAPKRQPPKTSRLMVGLLMIQHICGLADRKVAELWVTNPYGQYCCGYDYFQWQAPIEASALVSKDRGSRNGKDFTGHDSTGSATQSSQGEIPSKSNSGHNSYGAKHSPLPIAVY